MVYVEENWSMSAWHLYTDGSAVMGPQARPGQRFAGGWGAVVEHGSDGYTVRGREADTTNTRMELVAVIRGLESIEERGQHVIVHSDCSAVAGVFDRVQRGAPMNRGKDVDLWRKLAEQFGRMGRVEVVGIPKGGHPIHTRAHGIAGAEAKAMAAGLAPNMEVLSRIEKKERRRHAEKQERQRRLQGRVVEDDRGRPFAVEEAFHAALTRHPRRLTLPPRD